MKPDIVTKLSKPNKSKTKQLMLDNGRLSDIPFEVKDFSNLNHLSLFNNKLTKLPLWIFELKKLSVLNLSNNKFNSIPEKISEGVSIRNLSFKGNFIEEISEYLTLPSNLEKLDLSNNKFTEIKFNFSKYENLKSINISNNSIKTVQYLELAESIQSLNLSGNKIKSLPSKYSSLKGIKELDLSYNQITTLPDFIGEMENLRVLDLTGNRLESLPKSLSKLKKLHKLRLNGNPIGEVPIEISSQGLDSVLYYYLNLGESIPLNEAKLLIVGQGAVGKTFLMNKLVLNETPETVTTEGIDIRKWFIQSQGEQVRLNVWDFGGQEIYHSTHQFFLTKRSIYLLVWEARKDDSILTFDYWLNIISMLSNSSPVIIVLNKIDERMKEIDQKSIKEKFPNIVGFKSVSAKEGTNISELTASIENNISNLPHIKDKLPKIWNEVRTKLEEKEEDYIEFNTYMEICNKLGLDKSESNKLSKYFHDIGVFLYFSENPILKHIIFLNPTWATNCVYRILDLKAVVESYGRFSTSLIETNLDTYDSKQITYIIELMKKFELCFEISQGNYVVPELLNVSSPEKSYNFSNSISLNYIYSFMPAGIISRLIVRLKDRIISNEFWKNGLFINFESSIAKIVSKPLDRLLSIEVNGDSKAELLAIIRAELEIINETLNFPSHEMKIKCNCNQCERSRTPYMFRWDYLVRLKNANKSKAECEHSLNNIPLEKLIGPYEIKLKEYHEEFGFSIQDLTYDIVEISTRLLERKYQYKTEDLITDMFTDNLRSKNYRISDQTRSGKSNSNAGELDIMVRNPRNMPMSIIEAFRLASAGLGNTVIIEHINKLLLNYDTNGLERNFMLVYCQAEFFSQLTSKYFTYMENLHNHRFYNSKTQLLSIAESQEFTSRSNIKVFISEHGDNQNRIELFHILVNMR